MQCRRRGGHHSRELLSTLLYGYPNSISGSIDFEAFGVEQKLFVFEQSNVKKCLDNKFLMHVSYSYGCIG